MKKYNPSQIEKKWQEYWLTNETFKASENPDKEKKFVLVEFPYPSGEGMHMGHVRPYTAADVLARYLRMTGKEVLFPMGWDSFGLPAENYAIKHGVQPSVTTAKNISNIKRQFQSIGYSFDWSREFSTTDPEYYKWTQWLFLKFFEAGLAYEATGLINWCPKDKTGLANEEVVNGACERCGTIVEKKELRQWYLKITEYAEKLLEGLKNLPEWPEAVKLQQENWIGKSQGVTWKQKVKDLNIEVESYDSVPQTFMAQTFCVIAPEHPLIEKLVSGTEYEESVLKFVEDFKQRKANDQFSIEKEIEGIFTGRYIENPFGTGDLPIWIATFVISDYGSGIVNASAHDERDFAFAKKYNIPLRAVMLPEDSEFSKQVENLEVCYHHDPEAIMQQPEKFKGRKWGEVREDIIDYVEEKNYGVRSTQYKLRDWVFSRQRYWGEPIPIVHCDKDGAVAIPEDQLPVILPAVENYEPTGTGQSPLASIDEWVNTTCPKCGGPAQRETNTMPNWAGSSWYYLRYTDSKNDTAFAAQDKLKYWLPVDTYFGGMEHTTLHLLYSRFWNIFLYDQGLVPVSEPYTKRVPHGLIMASDGTKMSKSKGNVVNPDEIVNMYGADTTRMYELFLGPHKDSVAWSEQGIVGVARFLDKVWQWVNEFKPSGQQSKEIDHALHNLIKNTGKDIEEFSYNTAVSGFMKFYNEASDTEITMETMQTFVKLLYPFAPHLSEELFVILGGQESVQKQAWPQFDPDKLVSDTINIVVQVNGKVKCNLQFPSGSTEQEITEQVLQDEKISTLLKGQAPKRTIYIVGRLLNIVV